MGEGGVTQACPSPQVSTCRRWWMPAQPSCTQGSWPWEMRSCRSTGRPSRGWGWPESGSCCSRRTPCPSACSGIARHPGSPGTAPRKASTRTVSHRCPRMLQDGMDQAVFSQLGLPPSERQSRTSDTPRCCPASPGASSSLGTETAQPCHRSRVCLSCWASMETPYPHVPGRCGVPCQRWKPAPKGWWVAFKLFQPENKILYIYIYIM